jgi:hypothetical protein
LVCPADAVVTQWQPLCGCIALKACLSECGADAALIDDPEAINVAYLLYSVVAVDDMHEALLRVIRFCLKQVAVVRGSHIRDGASVDWLVS